jgi:pimeloyl-ACP methyl ester carboxylesterase
MTGVREQYVTSADGLQICVRERGSPGTGKAETVVLVHGYPDDQSVWGRVVGPLAAAGLHVATYDVRGAGRSDAPADVSGYRTERLVDDLVAVLDTVRPDGAVHLVGHDWGSVQLWEAIAAELSDPRLHGRIASFTSVSGPPLDHLAWLSRHRGGRRLRLLRQSLHSWYVTAFHVPVLPELVWRLGARVVGRRRLAGNATRGLNLYRANVLRRMRHPVPWRTDVPVLVVHPIHDAFLTPVVLEDLDTRCADLTVVRADAGHWLPRTHPDQLVRLVLDHVRHASER